MTKASALLAAAALALIAAGCGGSGASKSSTSRSTANSTRRLHVLDGRIVADSAAPAREGV
ncbi:hypothetical protein [Actinoallomurus soli]|uniref:hypothetical protein n=1 Tax=Actinoallomurus soli TaxID=2952535 RepID=UPI00209364D4|nr:hypothetical protein [Actinoallomurus soli]MCO5968322.1 hypothetical protein [Actinoallomurus soli]